MKHTNIARRAIADDRPTCRPLSFDARRTGCLTDQGEQELLELITALLSTGTTFFEDIFAGVRALVGDDRYEQLVSDLLTENDGVRWKSFPHPAGGSGYRILSR